MTENTGVLFVAEYLTMSQKIDVLLWGNAFYVGGNRKLHSPIVRVIKQL